jgi:hypothetical protein
MVVLPTRILKEGIKTLSIKGINIGMCPPLKQNIESREIFL